MLAGLAVFQLAGIKTESETKKVMYGVLEDGAVTAQAGNDAGVEDDAGGEFGYKTAEIDFDYLKQVNKDVIAWIMFDKNGLSYPVLQGADNEEYLYKMADGTKNPAGSIFADSMCSADFSDSHTILYGHNMKDLSMFGKLKRYRTQEGYYEENRFFTIYTPKQVCRYEIFAWYEAGEDDAVYRVGFEADDAFGAFVEQMLERRCKDTAVAAGKEDKIVTLSTCSANGMRFVVHGKRISVTEKERNDEEAERHAERRAKADIN